MNRKEQKTFRRNIAILKRLTANAETTDTDEEDEIMSFYPPSPPEAVSPKEEIEDEIEDDTQPTNWFEIVCDDVLKHLLSFCTLDELRTIRWGTDKRFHDLFKIKTLHKPEWLKIIEADDMMYYLYPSVEKTVMFQNLREVEFFVESNTVWYALQPILERSIGNFKIEKLNVYAYQLSYALQCFSAASIKELNVVHEARTNSRSFNFWEDLHGSLREVPNVKQFGLYSTLKELYSGEVNEADVFSVEPHTNINMCYPLVTVLRVPAAKRLIRNYRTKCIFPGLLKTSEYNIEWSRETTEQIFNGIFSTIEVQLQPVLKRKFVDEKSDLAQQAPTNHCGFCSLSSTNWIFNASGTLRCVKCFFDTKRNYSYDVKTHLQKKLKTEEVLCMPLEEDIKTDESFSIRLM